MAQTSLFVCVHVLVWACVAESEWKSSSARWAPVITGWDSFLIILSNINPVGWCRPSCGLMDNVITARNHHPTPTSPLLQPFYCSLLQSPLALHPLDSHFPFFITLFNTTLSLDPSLSVLLFYSCFPSQYLCHTNYECCRTVEWYNQHQE